MTTIIRNADHTIKTFLERGDDVVLSAGETLEFSDTSFVEYAKRLKITLNERSGETIRIPAGSGILELKVSCPGESTVSILVNDLEEVVALTNGLGMIRLSTDAPGFYLLKPGDRTQYAAAGESVLCVEVMDE